METATGVYRVLILQKQTKLTNFHPIKLLIKTKIKRLLITNFDIIIKKIVIGLCILGIKND